MMREILPLIQKPSHYLGSEINSVHKTAEAVTVRLALAFPDLYEVGMAYVGQRILYHLVNKHERYWAERVFAPAADAAALMRDRRISLSTLESDTPLSQMDVLAFSLTHELCYTTVLYMLDLAGLPLRAGDRRDQWPLVIAGGGVAFQPEPVAEFFDLIIVGDGEEVLVELVAAVEEAKHRNLSKADTIAALRGMTGVYDPACYSANGPTGQVQPICPGYDRIERRIVHDLDTLDFPTEQIVPFGKVVHDRYAMEIARGCTRGCRFCHAGMVYRPVRERSLATLDLLLEKGLDATGFEEVSFLSLSTGDFSTLEGLFEQSMSRCRQEQIAISLPSLRVGSLSPRLMGIISGIRRTGATLAPEAGSQRLRDVINKGITEQELLDHAATLFDMGWQTLKLYFMIGLPTEREEDLEAILDLCLKVRAAAGKRKKRLQITASISPFVPKPHTPFQWEEQLSLEGIRGRVAILRELFRPHPKLGLKWHQPEMSVIEGVFSRGGRELSHVVERAYRMGDILTSWKEHFSYDLWVEALSAEDLDMDKYLCGRQGDGPLPWDHINAGLHKRFLLAERRRALEGSSSPDCRYGTCRNCGVCQFDGHVSALVRQGEAGVIRPRVNLDRRDQEGSTDQGIEGRNEQLHEKAMHLRLWYQKTGPARYLSQLELQRVFERALRRACVPMTFSQGFHPLPLISFGRALSVGISSLEEWMNIYLREGVNPESVRHDLADTLPAGLTLLRTETLSLGKRQSQSQAEDFLICFNCPREKATEYRNGWSRAFEQKEILWERQTKKGRRTVDLRPFLKDMETTGKDCMVIRLDWSTGYLSPLSIVEAINCGIEATEFEMLKMRQLMPGDLSETLDTTMAEKARELLHC